MTGLLERLDAERVRLLDALVLFWCVFSLAVGAGVGYELSQLAQLGESLADSGRALDNAGVALQELRDIPLIGGAPGAIGDEVRSTAADAVLGGERAAGTSRRVALLLGLATALLPLAPVLWLYLPVRLGRRAQVREVRRLLSSQDPQEVDGYLAQRALNSLRPSELTHVTTTPWRDYRAGKHTALADAELARLGLSRPTA